MMPIEECLLNYPGGNECRIDGELKPYGEAVETIPFIVDALAVALAGERSSAVQATVRSMFSQEDGGAQGSSMRSWKAWAARDPERAALVIGSAIHALDFDDTYDPKGIHCLASVLPAAYSMAVRHHGSGADFVRAINVGTGVALRSSHDLCGTRHWMTTALVGTLGAAVAAMLAAGVDDLESLHNAAAIAASMASSTRQVVEEGSELKRLQPGLAAAAGVRAASLSMAGLSGPKDYYRGRHGFVATYSRSGSESCTGESAGPGSPWESLAVRHLSIKPYPSCRLTHAPISAALDLRAKLAGESVSVDEWSYRICVPDDALHMQVSRPWARRGSMLMDRQFSTPYLVAHALVYGSVELANVANDLPDPNVERLARSIRVQQTLQSSGNPQVPAIAKARYGVASSLSTSVDQVMGSPSTPLTTEQLTAKVESCLHYAGSSIEAADMWDWVTNSFVGETDLAQHSTIG